MPVTIALAKLRQEEFKAVSSKPAWDTWQQNQANKKFMK